MTHCFLGHERVNQNLSDEKLNPQKLIWIYPLEKKFLSTIICVPNFVASNYQKVITVIWLIFVFLKFGPLPAENLRCAPAA